MECLFTMIYNCTDMQIGNCLTKKLVMCCMYRILYMNVLYRHKYLQEVTEIEHQRFKTLQASITKRTFQLPL